MRRVRTRVLPEPAPAMMTSGAASVVTASRCASLRPSSRWSAPPGAPFSACVGGCAGEGAGATVSIAATLTPGCDSGGMVDVPEDRFEALVAEALDGIPEDLGRLIENVAVFVESGDDNPNLLGLYQGVPLTRREGYGIGGGMPDRITIYRHPITRRCGTDEEVVALVRTTVIHEVGHHFGIDDARLRELGYG